MTLPLASFALSSIAFGFSDCIDRDDPSSYKCRPGAGSMAAFAGGVLYFVATCTLCCCVRPMVNEVRIVNAHKLDEEVSAHGATSVELDHGVESSISSHSDG